jgi:hypothetical protein
MNETHLELKREKDLKADPGAGFGLNAVEEEIAPPEMKLRERFNQKRMVGKSWFY